MLVSRGENIGSLGQVVAENAWRHIRPFFCKTDRLTTIELGKHRQQRGTFFGVIQRDVFP